MLKELGRWIKQFPLPMTWGTPRRGPLPSQWSSRQWNAVLRGVGGMIGDVSIEGLMRSSATIACAGLISDTLSSAGLSIVQVDAVKGMLPVNQSDAADLLLTLDFDHLSSAIFGAALLGNGFIVNDGTELLSLDSFST